jgi:hypothetical protein
VGAVLVLGGALLVIIRKSPTASDVITEFLARGHDPAPFVFGPGLIAALGVVIALTGAIVLVVGLVS